MNENKNSNIVAFRLDPHKKKLLQDQADKNNMKLSEYCKLVLLDYLEQSMLLDTQKKLVEQYKMLMKNNSIKYLLC